MFTETATYQLAKVLTVNTTRRRVVLEINNERVTLMPVSEVDIYGLKKTTHAIYDTFRMKICMFGDIEQCLTYIENKTL